jgi:hypothetical protein
MLLRNSILVVALLAAAQGTAMPKAHAKLAPISVTINGAPLSIDPAPRYVHGRLLVPVRQILEALGLSFERIGNRIVTQVGAKQIWLLPGSKRASVNGEAVMLDSPPLELRGVLFAPLHFFTAALGAQASFNPKSQRVEIASSEVGQSSTVTSGGGGTREYRGIVQAVDNDSQPPSITLTSGASVKTIRIGYSAAVVIDDVVANTTVSGTLQDVHVGDYARIEVGKDNSVKRVVDAFASREGTIAALSGNTIVLSGGHVIVPTGVTSLSLNGAGASVSDLQIADDVTVRYNLETSEVREIIATRKAVGTAPPPGPVSIFSIEPSSSRPLRPGESFEVLMKGTPGGTASYDIGAYYSNITLAESAPGTYTARYTIPRGVNFAAAPLFGHLRVRDAQASRAQSTVEISASSTPPGIMDFAPDQGQTVNTSGPSIYATFAAGAVPVNVSSIALVINGHDVTSSATRNPTFIEYHPLLTYADGAVRVTVRVSDLAGNTASKSWTFSIRTH